MKRKKQRKKGREIVGRVYLSKDLAIKSSLEGGGGGRGGALPLCLLAYMADETSEITGKRTELRKVVRVFPVLREKYLNGNYAYSSWFTRIARRLAARYSRRNTSTNNTSFLYLLLLILSLAFLFIVLTSLFLLARLLLSSILFILESIHSILSAYAYLLLYTYPP